MHFSDENVKFKKEESRQQRILREICKEPRDTDLFQERSASQDKHDEVCPNKPDLLVRLEPINW